MADEILRDYLSVNLSKLAQDVAAVTVAEIDPKLGSDNRRANGINQARKALLAFLKHPDTATVRGQLQGTGQKKSVYERLLQGEFRLALQAVDAIAPKPGVRRLTSTTVTSALDRRALPFVAIEEIEVLPGKPPRKVEVKMILKGYTGDRLSAAQVADIVDLSDLVNGGVEHRFRLNLLRGEARLGLMQPDVAVTVLTQLRADGAITGGRRELVALRLAAAHLATADALFAASRSLDEQARDKVVAAYTAAIRAVIGAVSSDEPQFAEVIEYAQAQLRKANGHFNILGQRDSLVPVQRVEALEGLTEQHIGEARRASGQFQDYLSRANQLEDVEDQLRQELATGEAAVQIAGQRLQAAGLRVDGVDNQLAAIDSQEAFLDIQTVLQGTPALFTTAAALATTGGAAGVLGLTSTVVGFLARRQELEHQRRAARLQREIALIEQSIARAEQRIAQLRRDFVRQKLAVTGGRLLTADLYYALAEIYRRLATDHLAAAIRFAYLHERAVAFALARPSIQHIQLSYTRSPGDIFAAPDRLAADVLDTKAELVTDVQKPDEFTELFSLRESYPIEFAGFQQTGRLDFLLSLYELEKRRPGTSRVRIIDLELEVRGLIPPTGFTGTLTHMGTFLLRDRAGTLDAGTQRLLPTDEQVAEALERFETGASAEPRAGGVLVYALGPDTKQLDATGGTADRGSQVITLRLFEGFGPAGLWRLELGNLDLRLLSDVVLRLHLASEETDVFDLGPKVKALLAAYEQELADEDALDRIAAFSLRQQFPDALEALRTGPASIPLREADLPASIVDAKVKAVVVQALDRDGTGVEAVGVEVGRPDAGFSLIRTTGAGGFSEPLDAGLAVLPPDDRFPVVGTWSLRLADPGVLARVDDLWLFVLYSFRPADRT